MRAYIYAHDADTGETFWIARQNPVAEFDEEYECFTGDISTEIFLRDQLFLPDPDGPPGGLIPDPNTEEAPAYGVYPGTWIGVRIHPDVGDDGDD
jgi:hypothetical protein